MKKAYTIKDLDWGYKADSVHEAYRAYVPTGSYVVERNRREWEESGNWTSWRWSFCFDEDYDEANGDCDSAEQGKKLMQEEWIKRILPALEEVTHEKV